MASTDINGTVHRLIEGLKSKSDEERLRTVQDLCRVVDREMKGVSVQSYMMCLDSIGNQLMTMLTTGDVNEQKGSVLAMGCLAELDFMGVHNHCRRFAKHLLENTDVRADVQLAALEAHLIGQFGLVFPCDFVEKNIEHARRIVASDQSDFQKQFAILTLRELALNTPTCFFQQFGPFITSILWVFRDKNAVIRELAGITLKSALTLSTSRDARIKPLDLISSTNYIEFGASTGTNGSRPLFSGSSLRSGTVMCDQYACHPRIGRSNSWTSNQQDTDAPFSASLTWYRNCLAEAIRTQGDAPVTHTGDHTAYQLTSAKKLNQEDWIHGSLLLLTELLSCALPQHEDLLKEVDEMAGVPLFEFLSATQSEAVQALRTVLSCHWPSANAPCLLVATGILPSSLSTDVSQVLSSISHDVCATIAGGGGGGQRFVGSGGTTNNAATKRKVNRRQQPNATKLKPNHATYNLCGRVLRENIDRIWPLVLSWLNLRNPLVVLRLFQLLPRLVALSPSHFVDSEIHQLVLGCLFHYLRKEREKAIALLTISLIGYHMEYSFVSLGYQNQLLSFIRSYLPTRRDIPLKKRSIPLETASIISLGVLGKSLGSTMYEPLKEILDSMMSTGLNQPLVATCQLLTECVPQLRKEILDCILNDISMILMHNANNTNFATGAGQINLVTDEAHSVPNLSPLLLNLCGSGTLGSPSIAVQIPPNTLGQSNTGASPGSGASSLSRFVQSLSGKVQSKPANHGSANTEFSNVAVPGNLISGEPLSDAAVVALALRTLGSFDFSGHSLPQFVRHISDNLISVMTCELKEIRLEAVKTCAHLLLPWLKAVDTPHWYARPTGATVGNILSKLLTVGISDPDPDVRRCVFESVDRRFDQRLVEKDHLASLCLALQDERLEIRCLVIQRLGRLFDFNPAYVSPSLRHVFLQCLNDLANSGSIKTKERSALTLACLTASAPRFFASYAEPFIQILLSRIHQALPPTLRIALSKASLHAAYRSLNRCDDSFTLLGLSDDTAVGGSQEMKTAVLATQLAAQAAYTAAHAVASVASLSTELSLDSLLASAPYAAPYTQTPTTSDSVTGGGGLSFVGGPKSNSAAIAATGAAAAAAASAAVVVMNAAGTPGLDGGPAASTHLPFPLNCCAPFTGQGVPTHDISALVHRFGALLSEMGQNRVADSASEFWSMLLSPESSTYTNLNVPYAGSVKPGIDLNAFTPSLANAQWTEPTSVLIALFTTLGRLSVAAPRAIHPHMEEFVPLLFCMMQDSTCFLRRSIALWTLSHLVSNTGYVIAPYRRCPRLLPVLLDLLKREEIKSIRQEVLRALGVIGAIDPFKFKLLSGQVDTFGETGIAVSLHEDADKKGVDITQIELATLISPELRSTFFSVCSLSALIRTLRDPSLHSQLANIVCVVIYVLKQLGRRSVDYVRPLMPVYFKCFQNTQDPRLQEFLIRQLGSIMTVVGLRTKEFASDALDLLLAHWWDASNVQHACISILRQMSSVLGAEFRPYLSRLIPAILQTLQNEHNERNIILLLELLPEFGYALDEHIHILVPAVSSLLYITNETSLYTLLLSALDYEMPTRPQPAAAPAADTTPPNTDGAPPTDNAAAPKENTTTTQEQPVDTKEKTNQDVENLSELLNEPLNLSDSVDSLLGLVSRTATANGAMNGTAPSDQAAHSGASPSSGLSVSDTTVGSVQLRRSSLECLSCFADVVNLNDMASQIVHPACRILLTLDACQQRLQSTTLMQHHSLSSISNSSLKSAVNTVHRACVKAIHILYPAVEDVLTCLLFSMELNFKLYLPLVEKMLTRLHVRAFRFYSHLNKIEKESRLPKTAEDDSWVNRTSMASRSRTLAQAEKKELEIEPAIVVSQTNAHNLERAWCTSHIVNRDDWNQWLKTFTVALLRESPSPAIQACSHLSAIAPVIGRQLFNAAFMSCWPNLTPYQQDNLINTLELVMRVPDQSPEVSQTVLNLREFMAHADKYSSPNRISLPITLSLLADRAMRNRAYAKALYYKEQQFLEELNTRSSPSPDILSCLLTIFSKLQLEEAVNGVLVYATRNPQDKLANEEVWREKLNDWKCALNMYERKLEDERIRDKSALILGRLRCLRALGQWNSLNAMASERWDHVTPSMRVQMAPLACTAAWALDRWEQMRLYTSALPEDQSFDGAFYRTVLAIHDGQYGIASGHIAAARNLIDTDLTTMADESYDRAYPDLLRAQLLSEAEEVIQYKQNPERGTVLRKAWRARLRGCQSVVEDWSQIIQLRSLVLDCSKDLKTWLRFAGLCRKNNRLVMARQVLNRLMNTDPAHVPINEIIPDCDPSVVFAYTKLLWAEGAYEDAVNRLFVLKSYVLEPVLGSVVDGQQQFQSNQGDMLDGFDSRQHSVGDSLSENRDWKKLMTKCCLRLGHWYSELYTYSSPGCMGCDVGYPSFGSSLAAPILQNSVATIRRLTKAGGVNSGSFEFGSQPSRASEVANDPGYRINNHSFRRISTTIPGTGSSVEGNGLCSNGFSATNGGFAANTNWEDAMVFIIQCYGAATIHTPDNRRAWQSWAMANYLIISRLDAIRERFLEFTKNGSTSTGHASVNQHATPATNTSFVPNAPVTTAQMVKAKQDLQRCRELRAAPAVQGFVNSISLSPSANLQDSLRLINLLFKFGHLPEIREFIRDGLTKIRLDNWLLVIQQLLARIDTQREHVARIIVDLLISIGQHYPQAIIYPLVLSFKSGGSDRRRYNANRILYSMEEHSPQLCTEAFLLNEELIRLSITWVEMWSDALEDASRVYFGEKDIAKMFRLLHPLHQMMERGHGTIHESAFLQEHGADLANCRASCENYEKTHAKVMLQQAWEGYYTLYRRFSKQMNNLNALELMVASPRLLEYKADWQLAVPGTYVPHRPLVRIARVKNCLTFMYTKQRPRKLTIMGADGHQYVFLLKGHEDTRQDDRVMQFFGLVNTLLLNNPETLRRNLTIQRMSVIPLSTNTGLIGWVPNSDTLHSLIRDYREKLGILLNSENREMLRLAPDFDRLNVIQKTEIFEAGLFVSSGNDLAEILWLRSHSSEEWFERRTNFIRSMATMSMVGYILGLGDRHPSNIMLSRETGKVVHIDFGDCFEVAMMREKFPEKVPFRLTRMIIAAMEVTGIDGIFSHTCKMVMSLMRSNRESLLAVLEAFIHDPLLQWVLNESRKDLNVTAKATSFGDVGAGGLGMVVGNGMPDVLNTTTTTGAPITNGLTLGMIHGQVAPTVQQQQIQRVSMTKQHTDGHQNRPLPSQTNATRRHTDRTNGLPNANAAHGQHATHDQAMLYQYQQQQQAPFGRQATSPKRVFTDPNHPDSLSLRDAHRINPWRHHLCNGPWFGCYSIAKCLRRKTDAGYPIVDRHGLQGFIFSAKPPVEEESNKESDLTPAALGNARARSIMEKIHQKLTGATRDPPLDVPNQVEQLIREATSNQNLCQMYIGWCAFW